MVSSTNLSLSSLNALTYVSMEEIMIKFVDKVGWHNILEIIISEINRDLHKNLKLKFGLGNNFEIASQKTIS